MTLKAVLVLIGGKTSSSSDSQSGCDEAAAPQTKLKSNFLTTQSIESAKDGTDSEQTTAFWSSFLQILFREGFLHQQKRKSLCLQL